jgi:hypothetical protein
VEEVVIKILLTQPPLPLVEVAVAVEVLVPLDLQAR